MDDAGIWNVDHVAADALLAALRLKLPQEQMVLIAEHFARQRIEAYSWAAKRAHSYVIERLEAASLDMFERQGSEWNEGFRAAEELVIAMTPDELLELEMSPTHSRGQRLRAMLRQSGGGGVGHQKV